MTSVGKIWQLIRMWSVGISGRPARVELESLYHPTIEFRPIDVFLSDIFRKSGRENLYLGLNGDTFENFKRNNTDTIVFSAKSVPLLWFFETYNQAKNVLVPVRMSPAPFIVAILSLIKQLMIRQHLQTISLVKIESGNRAKTYIDFRVLNRRPQFTYLSPHVSPMDLFNMLEKKNRRYVVLRWFDELDNAFTRKDIDLLVDDEAVADIRAFVYQLPGTVPIDPHSINSLANYHQNSSAYYPQPRALEILDSRVRYQNTFFIPGEKAHFKSLAYHAIYHKGFLAGIPSEMEGVIISKSPKHDYLNILQNLATKADFSGPMTMEALDSWLKSHGWQPPRETLRKLSKENDWIYKRFFDTWATKQDLNLCVFIIRNRAVSDGYTETIKDAIANGGFTTIFERVLSQEESSTKAIATRGGNWGPDKYPRSGGGPGIILATVDLLPKQLTERQRQNPWLDNGRIEYFKSRLREVMNKDISESEQYNMLHSSDNTEEAVEYLDTFFPEKKDEIIKKAEKMVRDFKTQEPVLADLTAVGYRAKVELIRYGNDTAIKKTFKPGCEEYLKKELEILTRFSGLRPEIPPILGSGKNYFIVPFYRSRWDFNKYKWHSTSSRLMPLWVVHQSLDFLKFLYENNIYLPDAAPGNILIDEKRGLKFIDFELYQNYEPSERPARFEESYDMAGLPKKYYDPLGPGPKPRSYDRSWQPYTGLDLKSALYDPAWKAHLKRAVFRSRKSARQLKISLKHLSFKALKRTNALLNSLIKNYAGVR